AKVDRIACPWLIRKFVDSNAEFVFLPHDTNWSAITDGSVFDVPDAELGHHGEYCSFDAIIARYGLDKDLALVELAKIVREEVAMMRGWAYGNEAADGRISDPAAACYPVVVHEARLEAENLLLRQSW